MRLTVALLMLAGQALLFPAWANEVPLVPGGMDIVQGSQQTPIITSQKFSVGTLSPIAPAFNQNVPSLPPISNTGTMFDKLALGGYVTYAMDSYSLSSAIRNRDSITGTDFSAHYPGSVFGLQGTTALTLGVDWHHPTALFSPNSQTSIWDTFETANTGVSLSLSWNHAITPSLYLGGFASAQRSAPQMEDLLPQPNTAFKLGAGMGVKF